MATDLFGDILDPGKEFAPFAQEIVVEIDAKDGGDVRFIDRHLYLLG
jgi:hypothetical protein